MAAIADSHWPFFKDFIFYSEYTQCFIYTFICKAEFQNTHRFTAALQKVHESILQFTVICYQRKLSKLCISEMYKWQLEKNVFI
jgi:uncharacterized membrane protein